MSQYKTGTATVTNGSATVTGTNTLWLANVTSGDSFTVAGDGVMYDVASVDSDTQITLSVAYAGVTASGAVYAIGTGFTVPDSFPEMSQGDIETATIFTRAMRTIQGKFTGIETNTTAEIEQAVSNHVALPDPHSQYADQANTYTETEVDNLLDDKADKATTYTETEVDGLLNTKADQANTYTETEVDGLLNTKADQANTYTETEVDELTGSLAYPNTTLASSSDISGSLRDPTTAYPHIQGFRTGTGTALTFAQVVEEAAERGARLLTIQELEAGVAAGTGFVYNEEITWTSSPAGVGLVYGNSGDGLGTRVVLNTNTDTAAGGYAVSVVGQRQWTDTQYADKATTYTETEVDNLLDDKANISGQIFTGEINYRGAGGNATNTGYGENVLQNNTTGGDNTANGRNALTSNTTGGDNTANGRTALYNNTTGSDNTANGGYTLFNNTEGNSNTANGRNALASNTTGGDNTANGRSALVNNTEGDNNTACGYGSGTGIETGSGNSIFGANVTGLAPDLTDNLILASGGVIRLQHDGVGTTTVQGDLVADNLYTETEVDNLLDDKSSLQAAGLTVTVGTGGDYPTINAALEYLSKLQPVYDSAGITATINLLTGFTMAEQVLVRGLDLGWITITGVDGETTITNTALTTDFTTADYGFDSSPAFGVSKGGVLPRIDQLFRFNVANVGGNKHGIIAVGAGSSADVLAGAGVNDAGTFGIYAAKGSTINAEGADASGAGNRGITASNGSTINAEEANASGAGGNGIYASRGSTINAYAADTSSAGTHGISAAFGSTINAALATGTLSQAINTVTRSGIIFQ